MATTPKTFSDFLSEFSGGVNGGIPPQLLPKNQLASALNLSLRGGFARPRPPYQKKTFNFNGDFVLQTLVLTGKFQGAGYYRPDAGTESLVAQISGHLILFTESGNGWLVTDISIPGDYNDPNVGQVWMWQSEKWLIVQDGSGILPIFYDGTSSRRSYGPSVLLGTTAADFTPPAIGSTVSLTLTAPYTGPYDIPVILNGEFYQPTRNAGGYEVILTNIQETPGTAEPVNTAVVIQPGTVGIITNPGPLSVGSGFHILNVTMATITGLRVGAFAAVGSPGDHGSLVTVNGVSVNGGAPIARLMYARYVNATTKAVEFQDAVSFGGTLSVAINSIVVDQANTSPNVIIGYTTVAFPAPAVGASVTTILTNPYTGDDGQVVYLQSKAYTIAKPPPGPPSTTLIVINLTDGSAALAVQPKTLMSVPEIPAGRQGAYGMGCNCCVLTDGISYIVADVVGSGAGTQANNYRDAVLKVTQNEFLFGGGSFRLPGTGDIATAVIFPPNLDTSLGQGPLQIGTAFSFFTNVVPGTDPANWPNLTTPIQTESLKDNGPLGQNSTICVNSDIYFRSNIGFGSLILARRDFNEWGNVPISNEMSNLLDQDDQTLLQYGSSLSFENRFLSTSKPSFQPNGIVHQGIVGLNFELISTLRQKLPPAWEGLKTGLNIFQAISGRVNGSLRSFAFSYNFLTSSMELYEFLPDKTTSFADNDETRILWDFDTAIMFNQDVKDINELVQLQTGEVYLSDIRGDVNVKVYYRPDYYPCWTLWREFDVCQSSAAPNAKPGYRTRIGLGQPSADDCEVANNRPLRNGYFFQFRVVITGACVWKGMRARAIAVNQPELAPPLCEPGACQAIDCDVPDEYALYSLQGFPPVTPPPDNTELPFANQTTYLTDFCGTGAPYFRGENLPTWVTVDSANNQIIGAAGMFRGATQEAANAAGVSGLRTAISALNIQCGFYNTEQVVTCADSSHQTVPAGLFFSEISQATADNLAIALGVEECANAQCLGTVGTYQIFGYFDGMVANPGGDAAQPGDVPWDGTLLPDSGCAWKGVIPINAGTILIGNLRCCARIFFHSSPDFWTLEVFANIGGNCFTRWGGTKSKGTSPAGTYTQNDGSDPGPATLNVVPV